MGEIAFSIGNLDVRWYSIILTTGMIAALFLLIFMLKKTGQPSDLGLEIFLWVIPLALIFARLFYVVPREEFYPIDSWEAFVHYIAIWEGGITIVGGLVGGIIGVICCSLVRKKSIMRIADCLVCPVLLGQIIGRWGNFVNQEVYGLVVNDPDLQRFPIAVFIEQTGQWHMASFFYEMMLNLIAFTVFLILFLKYRDKLKVGTLTVSYLLWYNLIRACLEFVKYDPLSTEGGIKVLQTMCFVFAGICAVLLILTQTGKLKWETAKMRDRHFAPEPPPKPRKKKGESVESLTADVNEAEISAVEGETTVSESTGGDGSDKLPEASDGADSRSDAGEVFTEEKLQAEKRGAKALLAELGAKTKRVCASAATKTKQAYGKCADKCKALLKKDGGDKPKEKEE